MITHFIQLLNKSKIPKENFEKMKKNGILSIKKIQES